MAEQLAMPTPVTITETDRGSADAAPLDGLANLEDKGRWLTFRVLRVEGSG